MNIKEVLISIYNDYVNSGVEASEFGYHNGLTQDQTTELLNLGFELLEDNEELI